ncbi:MAG TPA: DNA-3-methyladenine glycosylase I [Thermoanaerobaculia bacterium]|nr:DNA-3-methyladenine glycosylase I [Thermoanaerobaculia bacterium]
MLNGDETRPRCPWAGTEPGMLAYHDREWGVPVHDDRTLFEFLVLEGAQAGLSWRTILARREGYRRAFAGFDPEVVAGFSERDVERLLGDAGIVRNRAKVEAAIGNARRFLEVRAEHGTFDGYLWGFVGGRPRSNAFRTMAEVPATTPEAEALSRDLRGRGFRFVGPTIVYATMQAVGLVNDHLVGCFRWSELSGSTPAPAGSGDSPASLPPASASPRRRR